MFYPKKKNIIIINNVSKKHIRNRVSWFLELPALWGGGGGNRGNTVSLICCALMTSLRNSWRILWRMLWFSSVSSAESRQRITNHSVISECCPLRCQTLQLLYLMYTCVQPELVNCSRYLYVRPRKDLTIKSLQYPPVPEIKTNIWQEILVLRLKPWELQINSQLLDRRRQF